MLAADDLASFDDDGFVMVGAVLDTDQIERLHERFVRVFCGEFETGTAPDEVNWLEGESDPTLTRQICNAWKADRLIAATVLDERLGAAVARLAGWPGARIVQDNVIWKPPGAKSLGFHRDNAYLAWYTPSEMCSCWIALDDTSASGGTLELARGSHRWPTKADPQGEFHAPDDYRTTVAAAAETAGAELDIAALEMTAGEALRFITDGPGTARVRTVLGRTVGRWCCTVQVARPASAVQGSVRATARSTPATHGSTMMRWTKTISRSCGTATATALPAYERLPLRGLVGERGVLAVAAVDGVCVLA